MSKYTADDLKDLKRPALTSICESLKLETSGLDKTELIELILKGKVSAKKVKPAAKKPGAQSSDLVIVNDDADTGTNVEESDDILQTIGHVLRQDPKMLGKIPLRWNEPQLMLTPSLWFLFFQKSAINYETVYESETRLEGSLLLRIRRILTSFFPDAKITEIDNIVTSWVLALDMFLAADYRAQKTNKPVDWSMFYELHASQIRTWQETIRCVSDAALVAQHGEDAVRAVQAQRAARINTLPVGDADTLEKVLRKTVTAKVVGKVDDTNTGKRMRSDATRSPTQNKTCTWCGAAVTGRPTEFFKKHNPLCTKRNGRTV